MAKRRVPGRKYLVRRMFPNTFSNGRPSFSYIAKRNPGSMSMTMPVAAPLVPSSPLVRK